MSRWLRVLMIAAVAVFAGTSVAHAQYPPTKTPTLVISQDVGPPGFTFTATVTSCVPGQRIVFVLGNQRVEATCDPVTMQASASITTPPGLGTFTVTAEFYGDCSSFGQGPPVAGSDAPCFVLSQAIQVVAATTTTTLVPGGNIPATGSSGVNSTLTSALVLVVAGFGVFLVSRARRRPDKA